MSKESNWVVSLLAMCIVVILTLSLLGTVVTFSKPGYHNETGTLYADTFIAPLGDLVVEWTYVGGSGLTNHTQALTQEGEPDGNTSFISEDTPGEVDLFQMSRPSIPIGGTVDSVSAFLWSRKNLTGGAWKVAVNISDAVDDCTYSSWSSVTIAWTNYTKDYPSSCDGNPWVNTDLLDMHISIATTLGGAPDIGSVTYVGIVITYSYSGIVSVQDTGPYVNLIILIPLVLVIMIILMIVIWWNREN